MKPISYTKSAHLNRQKKREYIIWYAITCILFIVFISTTKAAYSMYQKSKDTEKTANKLKETVTELERRHDLAKYNAQKIETQRGLDQEIRKRYGVKKPGEGVIILVDSNNNTTKRSY